MRKNKRENSQNKYASLLIVIVVFATAFFILIKAQQKDNYYLNVRNSDFSIKSEYGKKIVAKDTKAIYPKYYVVNFSDNEYSIYVFNYYETSSQYELEFSRLLDKIVDYNVQNKMIRYLHSRGYGIYDEVLNNLSTLLENENIEIIGI